MVQPFLKARLAYLLIGVITLPITLEASAAEIKHSSLIIETRKNV